MVYNSGHICCNTFAVRLRKLVYSIMRGRKSRRFKQGGGGTGGSKPPASRILQSWLPPLFSWLPPFCPFSIAKYYAMLRNFPLFLPLPALSELPPPALSSPASRTPPALYSPGLPPPLSPPPSTKQVNCDIERSVPTQWDRNCWFKF